MERDKPQLSAGSLALLRNIAFACGNSIHNSTRFISVMESPSDNGYLTALKREDMVSVSKLRGVKYVSPAQAALDYLKERTQ